MNKLNKITEDGLKVNKTDINFTIDIKDKTVERSQTAIILTNKAMREFNKTIEEHFIDFTYKIIPKKHHEYKLIVISDFNKDENIISICF